VDHFNGTLVSPPHFFFLMLSVPLHGDAPPLPIIDRTTSSYWLTPDFFHGTAISEYRRGPLPFSDLIIGYSNSVVPPPRQTPSLNISVLGLAILHRDGPVPLAYHSLQQSVDAHA